MSTGGHLHLTPVQVENLAKALQLLVELRRLGFQPGPQYNYPTIGQLDIATSFVLEWAEDDGIYEIQGLE